MIILFGAPGSGKSMQGQMLAARHGWRWLSTGQILRDSRDLELAATMKAGRLVDDDKVCQVVEDAIARARDIKKLIIDGFPRTDKQARWLMTRNKQADRRLDLVICLTVSDEEIENRLKLRGRVDDSGAERKLRHELYETQQKTILKIIEDAGIKIVKVSGEGTVGAIHDRIEEVLEKCLLA